MIKLIIFDYGGTIYNPTTDQLYPVTEELLTKLRDSKFKLSLVSRADNVKQRLDDFKRFYLGNYFEFMEAVPETRSKNFIPILKKFNFMPEECLVVGDYVKSEIKEGNKIGIKTIWIKNGEFPNVLPQKDQEKPDYMIESLENLLPLINTL